MEGKLLERSKELKLNKIYDGNLYKIRVDTKRYIKIASIKGWSSLKKKRLNNQTPGIAVTPNNLPNANFTSECCPG